MTDENGTTQEHSKTLALADKPASGTRFLAFFDRYAARTVVLECFGLAELPFLIRDVSGILAE